MCNGAARDGRAIARQSAGTLVPTELPAATTEPAAHTPGRMSPYPTQTSFSSTIGFAEKMSSEASSIFTSELIKRIPIHTDFNPRMVVPEMKRHWPIEAWIIGMHRRISVKELALDLPATA